MGFRAYWIAWVGVLAVPMFAWGQNNFFNRGGVALYEPVVDVVNSGARLVATPTVSADRKYVTLSMQPQLSQLVALQNFPVATFGNLNGGNVGGVPGPVGGAGQGGQPGPAPDANGGIPAPVQEAVPGNNLRREGMTLIASLK